MVLGGIPYYLEYMSGKYSIATNIDHLVFDEDAPLHDEFEIDAAYEERLRTKLSR